MATAIKTAPRKRTLRKGILTLLTIGAVGALGVYASTALLSDDVALSTTVADGATLAVAAIADSNYTFTGLDNMQPGEYRQATFWIRNQGSVPGKLSVTTDFENITGDCFNYSIIREAANTPNWAPFKQTTASVAKQSAGTLAVGGIGMRLDVRVEMTSDCTLGSGLESTKRNVNNGQYYGTAELAFRHPGHAKASLDVSFDLEQITA